jgi:flavodoxin
MKALVVYFSLSGKTEIAAKSIAEEFGADIRRIEEVKARTNLAAIYVDGGHAASQDKMSEIKPISTDFTGYDLVVIGTPNWANRPAPAVNAFVAGADFTDKMVITFSTMGGRPGYQSLATNLNGKIAAKSGRVVGSFAIRSFMTKDTEIAEKARAEIRKLPLEINGNVKEREFSVA